MLAAGRQHCGRPNSHHEAGAGAVVWDVAHCLQQGVRPNSNLSFLLLSTHSYGGPLNPAGQLLPPPEGIVASTDHEQH